jgi:hypothetical protein
VRLTVIFVGLSASGGAAIQAHGNSRRGALDAAAASFDPFGRDEFGLSRDEASAPV